LLLLALYVQLFTLFKNRKINGKRFYKLEYQSSWQIGFINLGLLGEFFCKEWIEQYEHFKTCFFLWVLVLEILFLITGKKKKSTRSHCQCQKQYQLI
jgi:hypothetical protein